MLNSQTLQTQELIRVHREDLARLDIQVFEDGDVNAEKNIISINGCGQKVEFKFLGKFRKTAVRSPEI